MTDDRSIAVVPLPDGAPDGLREFVSCEVDQVDLDMHDRTWLPRPPHVPAALIPTVSIDDGWTPDQARVAVHFGMVAVHLDVEIVEGRLHVHTARLPFGIGHEISDGIDDWVDAVNQTLRANGKQLDALSVSADTITITKRSA